MLNDDAIKAGVLSIRPRYNLATLPEDIQAINAISRVREGKTLRYIEKCKAVFVTKNTVLVSATMKFLEEQEVDVGFPLAITDEDLCKNEPRFSNIFIEKRGFPYLHALKD